MIIKRISPSVLCSSPRRVRVVGSIRSAHQISPLLGIPSLARKASDLIVNARAPIPSTRWIHNTIKSTENANYHVILFSTSRMWFVASWMKSIIFLCSFHSFSALHWNILLLHYRALEKCFRVSHVVVVSCNIYASSGDGFDFGKFFTVQPPRGSNRKEK